MDKVFGSERMCHWRKHCKKNSGPKSKPDKLLGTSATSRSQESLSQNTECQKGMSHDHDWLKSMQEKRHPIALSSFAASFSRESCDKDLARRQQRCKKILNSKLEIGTEPDVTGAKMTIFDL